MTDAGDLPDSEMLAASLALGFLEGQERSEALRLLLKNPEFARRARVWQQVGDSWLEEVAPVAAPDGLLDRIEARLDHAPRSEGVSGGKDRSGAPGFWRIWAISATAASLVLGVGLGLAVGGAFDGRGPAEENASARRLANVAQIAGPDGTPLVSALYSPSSGTLSLRLSELGGPGLGPELWVIPPDGAPRSLGMIDGSRLTITISPELRALLSDGAKMAITLEPKDSPRHDAPTGSILGVGQLQEVPQQTKS